MSDLADAPFVTAGDNLRDAPFAQARPAGNVWEAMQAGWQSSGPGLLLRGKMPDIALDSSHAKWYERAVSGITQTAVEIPEMVLGGAFGAAAGAALGGTTGPAAPIAAPVGAIVGSGMGMFAVPAIIRQSLIEAYTKGDVQNTAQFLDSAKIILKEGGKAAAIGAVTAGAGAIAARTLGTAIAPSIGTSIGVGTATKAIATADAAAQIGALVVAPAALEGRLPEPQEFMDAAIVIAGVKVAAKVAPVIGNIYSKTGKTPAEVAADANADPSIKADIAELAEPAKPDIGLSPEADATRQMALDLGVPRAYLPMAASETAHSIVPGIKAEEVAAKPFAELATIQGEPKPTHVNYNYINTTTDAKLALARLSEVYESDIQEQRRGSISWQQTSVEAGRMLTDLLGNKGALAQVRDPGTPAGAAELLARKQMTVGASEAMMTARDNLLAKGDAATHQDKLDFLMAIDRSAMIQQEFLGARAEAGRALNILKSTATEAERAKLVQNVIEQYGKDPVELAQMLKSIDTPEGAAKFAREAVKATTWEKIIEGWKAGLLSGPTTHFANILGNGTFAALRVPIDSVASIIGHLRGADVADRVSLIEPIARITGLIEGAKDGLRVGLEALKTEDSAIKAEQYRHAIEGTKGQIIRIPFRLLGAEDAVFSTMSERAEAYSLATRQATAEGLNPLTHEFRARIGELVNNPTPEMQTSIEAAGKRFTFNEQLGAKGRAAQNFIRQWHLEWMIPFVRTPANIAKELIRMTPFAPFVGEWRAAIAEGGVARDKAVAEILAGSATMAAVASYAFNGTLTGQGDPDPGKRRVEQAAGKQPYSIKIGDKYYSYQRLQPIGTLIGMAADMAAVWDHMTEEESDKVPRMISVAFGNAITNQTFLQGITNIVNAMSDPTRFGPRLLQNFAGSAVPSMIAQPTAMYDPLSREVDSMLDAVKSRIPGLRQELLPKRDIFGEPIPSTERLAGVLPITVREISQDKARTEAARVGFSVADTPKKTHIGAGTGKLGDVKLEPGERDVFSQVGGRLAHDIMTQLVNEPSWDQLPDMVKLKAYQNVFTIAHKAGAYAAIPIEKRIGLINQISEKVRQQLEPEGVTQ